tara:strand:- start:236 stop:367 length:132 start_codon:yes stop_codon:yes gene_type:complete
MGEERSERWKREIPRNAMFPGEKGLPTWGSLARRMEQRGTHKE